MTPIVTVAPAALAGANLSPEVETTNDQESVTGQPSETAAPSPEIAASPEVAPTEDADSSAVAEPGKDAAAEEVPAAEDSSLPTQLNAEQEDTGTPAHEVPEAQAEEVIKPATPESLANTDPVYDVLEPTGITDEPVVELIPRGLFSYTDIDNILMRRINEARIAEGAKALFAAPHLYTSAVEWSEEKYAQGYVSNSPTLEDDVMFSGACVTTNKIGETVSFADFYDYDQTVAWTADEIAQSIFDGYMASELETLLSS